MNSVCMVVLSLYPQDPRVRRQAEALERDGIAVDVICLRGDDQTKTEQLGLVTAHRVMKKGYKDSIGKYIWMALKFSTLAFILLQRLTLKKNYKMVQVHNMPDFLVFVGALHRIFGTPLVLDLHDLSVELFGSKWGDGRKSKILPFVEAVEKASCRFANRLITTSIGFHNRLIERGNPAEKITLVINTADSHIFKYHAEREFPKITHGAKLVYHGTVQERFGLHKAIEAMGHLRERIPGSTLNIYGSYDPDYRQRLADKIAELSLQDGVFLNGFVSLDEISSILRNSDIGLVPYESDDFMNLALSTKTFEYATTGLPVVASRLDSITSIFDDDAVRFADPAGAEDFAAKIAELCLDPERRRSQSETARNCLAEISDKIMADRYLKLVRSLTNGNGALCSSSC